LLYSLLVATNISKPVDLRNKLREA
jgi:hypothetical protein